MANKHNPEGQAPTNNQVKNAGEKSGKENNKKMRSAQVNSASPSPVETEIKNKSESKNDINSHELGYFPQQRRKLLPVNFYRAALEPLSLITRSWRQELPWMFGVFLCVFLLYAISAPRLVCLEDDGLFIMNLEYIGVAHPPGYPLYTLLGSLFYHFPLSELLAPEPAYRGHLFSGFVGSISCVAIYCTIVMLVRGRAFAILGAFAYASSMTFWSQAIIAEVYTLNSMMYFIILALCVKYASQTLVDNKNNHFILYCIIAFAFGLSLTNHMPLMGLGGIGLGLLVLSQWKNIVKRIPFGAFALLLGLLPYAWMVWRSHSGNLSTFYGPIEDKQMFEFYVLRKGYVGVDNQDNVGLEDKLEFVQFLGEQMLWQYTPLGFLLVLVGMYVMARSRYNWAFLSLFVAWLASSWLLILLLDFKAEFIWFSAFRVYPLVAYGIMAIWLAIGASALADKVTKNFSMDARKLSVACMLFVLIGAQISAHWKLNYRADYRWAHDFASYKLEGLEPNAAYFTFDDLDVPLMHLRYVENLRADTDVFNDQGLVLGNRLYPPLIPDFPPEGNPNTQSKQFFIQRYIDANVNERPIYYHSQRVRLYRHPRYGSDFMGFYRRVNREDNHDRIILSEALRDWLDTYLNPNLTFTDNWTRHQHYNTVATLINTIITASISGFQLDERWQEVIDRAREQNKLARIITNLQYISNPQLDEQIMQREWDWAEGINPDDHEELDKRGTAYFYQMKALYASRLLPEQKELFEDNLLNSISYTKNKENPALQILLQHYHAQEQYCKFLDLLTEYYPTAAEMDQRLLKLSRTARKANCSVAANA